MKDKEVTLENAYVIPAEVGDRIRMAFGEIPRKYNQLIGPLEQALAQAYRVTMTLNEKDEEKG